MKRNKGQSKIISLVTILIFLSIGISYMYGILSENDEQINVTGTGYEQSYNSNVKVQTTTGSMLAPVGFIIGATILVILGKSIFK